MDLCVRWRGRCISRSIVGVQNPDAVSDQTGRWMVWQTTRWRILFQRWRPKLPRRPRMPRTCRCNTLFVSYPVDGVSLAPRRHAPELDLGILEFQHVPPACQRALLTPAKRRSTLAKHASKLAFPWCSHLASFQTSIRAVSRLDLRQVLSSGRGALRRPILGRSSALFQKASSMLGNDESQQGSDCRLHSPRDER